MQQNHWRVSSLPMALLWGALLLFSCSKHDLRVQQLNDLQAQNQADTVFRSDSLQKILVDHFNRHGTANEQMLANYLLGRAYADMGESPKALQAYHDAAEYADTLNDCDYSLLMRVHAQTADLFFRQYLPNLSLQEIDLACACALKSNDSLSYALCKEQKVRAYYQLGENDSILMVSNDVHSIYQKLGKVDYSARSMSTAIAIQIRKNMLKEAKANIEELENYVNRSQPNDPIVKGALYSYKGAFAQATHAYDSAIYYYRKQRDLGNDLRNVVSANRGLYLAYEALGKTDSVAKYAKEYCTANDSSNVFVSADRIQSMYSLYNYDRFQQLAEKQSLELKIRDLIITIVLIIIVTIAIIVFFSILNYARRQRKRIEETNKKYAETLTAYQKEKDELDLLKSTVSSNAQIIEKKEKEIERLKEIITSFQADNVAPDKWEKEVTILKSDFILSLHKHAAKGLVISEPQFLKLEETVKDLFPTFEDGLERKAGHIKYKHRLVCLLTKLRFLPSEISTLADMSYSSLSNMRKRLLSKLFGETGGASDFDEKIYHYQGDVS